MTDARGRALVNVALREADSSVLPQAKEAPLGVTGADGCLQIAGSDGSHSVVVKLNAFAPGSVVYPAAGSTAILTLKPETVQQNVTVTANRGLPGTDTWESSVVGLADHELAEMPGLALDDRLRQVAGFALFRRTSSWSANPTSQGVSLRGLGSTAASRTLVVSDQVPLNDPFGGWVHWNEVPSLAISSISLLRGGAADLYGSSAIGGVIDLVPVEPAVSAASGGGAPSRGATISDLHLSADASGATENSALGDGLGSAATRYGSALGALSVLSTGGYVATAPSARGIVDVPSNVVGESARMELRSATDHRGGTAFLRGNVLNEARSNGTPFQTNGTRLWRYQAGGDMARGASSGSLRLFGSRETYRQSFSSISADRNSESLTRLQRLPTNELGFALQGARAFPRTLNIAAGVDARDIRATDAEGVVKNSTVASTTSISARQREVGGYLDGEWRPSQWTLAASARVDSFRTFNSRQTVTGSTTAVVLPEIDELVASPHVGLTRFFGRGVALSANAFRAFRGPTMNELYRTGQVGQQTTLANNNLLSERATGFAFGSTIDVLHRGSLRAEYFWTEVNRPISAVLLSQTGAGIQTLQRENLGQIRSRGLMLEARSTRMHDVDTSVSYQLAFATVTAFRSDSPAQNDLTGKWIPQVPRESVTAGLNYTPRFVSLHAFMEYTGQQFDDSENQYRLHPFARLDASAERTLPHGLSVFGSVQNLLNRAIDAGRTPVLTLASPRLVQGGLRYSFTR